MGRSRFLGGFLLALWLIACLLMLSWFFLTQYSAWRAALAGSMLIFAGVIAGIGWKNAPAGQLAWDGQVWRWESPGYQAGVAGYRLAVVADFQRKLLLRLENQAHASIWLWVEQKAFAAKWLELRRAIYSPHKSSAELSRFMVLDAEPAEAALEVKTLLVDSKRAKP